MSGDGPPGSEGPRRIGPSRRPRRGTSRRVLAVVATLVGASVLLSVVDRLPGPNRRSDVPRTQLIGAEFPKGLRAAPDSAGPRVTFAVTAVELFPPEPQRDGRVCRRYAIDLIARVSGRPLGIYVVGDGFESPNQLTKTSDTEWRFGPYAPSLRPLCGPRGSTRTLGRGLEVGVGRNLEVVRRRPVRPTRITL